jgi:hypothetical protein
MIQITTHPLPTDSPAWTDRIMMYILKRQLQLVLRVALLVGERAQTGRRLSATVAVRVHPGGITKIDQSDRIEKLHEGTSFVLGGVPGEKFKCLLGGYDDDEKMLACLSITRASTPYE